VWPGLNLHGSWIVFHKDAVLDPKFTPIALGGDDRFKFIFLDDIPSVTVKQDVPVEFMVMDSVLALVRAMLPALKRVFVVADRGASFAGALLPPILAMLGCRHGLRVIDFIHNQEEDGKTALVSTSEHDSDKGMASHVYEVAALRGPRTVAHVVLL